MKEEMKIGQWSKAMEENVYKDINYLWKISDFSKMKIFCLLD